MRRNHLKIVIRCVVGSRCTPPHHAAVDTPSTARPHELHFHKKVGVAHYVARVTKKNLALVFTAVIFNLVQGKSSTVREHLSPSVFV